MPRGDEVRWRWLRAPALGSRSAGGVRSVAAVLAAAVLWGAAAGARAQQPLERWSTYEPYEVGSPEHVLWEVFAVGPYEPEDVRRVRRPDGSALFDDAGPLVVTGLHVVLWRFASVGLLTAGVRAGWARYAAVASSAQQEAGEQTVVELWPLAALLGLRIDALARSLGVPLWFGAHAGLQLVPWTSSTGGRHEGGETSLGLRWGVQAGLELDFAEPRAARRLDEQWGINHTWLFFELGGATSAGQVPMGDGLHWLAGLAFVI